MAMYPQAPPLSQHTPIDMLCVLGMLALLAMHAMWYLMFVRIAYRIAKGGADACAEEYQGEDEPQHATYNK